MEKIDNPINNTSTHESSPDSNNEIQTIEKHRNSIVGKLYQYDGVWYTSGLAQPIQRFQKYFKSRHTDIILATMPKAGTTWLKALAFSIVHRGTYSIDTHPILTSNPHNLVPLVEFQVYMDQENPDLESIPDPRIFATHVHYDQLPISIKESSARIVYICRNPMDTFVSLWHFFQNIVVEMGEVDRVPSIDEAFDMYCQGIHIFGPFWDHMLGYWNQHLKCPDRVLFLKYEDLKTDVVSNVKKIAEFIGCPFLSEEEERGVIEEICNLCSFDNLKDLKVNNKEGQVCGVRFPHYFRKGEIGDWENHLTKEKADRVEKIMESKLKGFGLTFKLASE